MARALILAVSSVLCVNALWLALTANLTLGTVLVALVGLGLGAWGASLHRQPHPRLVNSLVGGFCAAIIALSGFLAWFGVHDDARFNEDAVIVLGAAVHGRELSNTLQGRLVTALAYYRENPKALVVVSGGQGPQEDLPEGVAMRDYLVRNGVPADGILVDDRSTSTEENFDYAKALLDRRLAPGYTIVFVTDEFHVYRAARLAAAEGLLAHHLSARTPWYFWPADYLREVLLVVKEWLVPS